MEKKKLSTSFTLRKNIDKLKPDELKNFRTAYSRMMKIKDNRGYSYYAGYHGLPHFLCWHHGRDWDGYTEVHLFLPWHRAYLYRFEKALQDQMSGVTLPWWDWRTKDTKKAKIPDAFSAVTVDGEPNPLYKFHISLPEYGIDKDTQRFPGESVDVPSSLPTPDEIATLIDDPKRHFDDFSNDLEDFHDSVHGWTGGSVRRNGGIISGEMSDISLAAFDPIFWSHHCMIDMFWWKWQKKHGIYNIPAHYRRMALEPFGLTVEQVLDIYELGYDYVETETSTDGNLGG